MITALMTDLGEKVKEALTTTVTLVDIDTFPDVDEMFSEVPKWHRIEDAVCVVADLKGSTKLNFGKYSSSSAKLYEALTSNMVRIVTEFDPVFVDIQGDGLFAIFHGPLAYERGFCAGVTLKTFSVDVLVPEIESKFQDFPDTGLKVGMHAGLTVVKKVGVRSTNEPVWAGKLVNWAVKAAQFAEAHELVATQKVYNHFKDNRLVTHTCGCPDGIPALLWSDRYVTALPDTDSLCRVLRSKWCADHGDDYCGWISDGLKAVPAELV
jgi:class 3 adenylate cyclase